MFNCLLRNHSLIYILFLICSQSQPYYIITYYRLNFCFYLISYSFLYLFLHLTHFHYVWSLSAYSTPFSLMCFVFTAHFLSIFRTLCFSSAASASVPICVYCIFYHDFYHLCALSAHLYLPALNTSL